LMLSCHHCGAKTPDDLLYCLNCRASLIPSNKYDLNVRDFAYGPDLDAMGTIKVAGFLPFLLKSADRVQYPSDFDEIMRQCASVLSLDALPDVFVSDGNQLNAFTFGTEERAYVVCTSALLRIVSRQELEAVLSHEFAHVKSGHMLYHTLAEILANGIGTSASLLGLDLISVPIRLALLSWHRESEVTADRASLLAVNDIKVLRSLLSKLASALDPVSSGQTQTDVHKPGALETLGELFRTHPLDSNRFRLANDFWQSQEFKSGRRKIELRQRLLRGLTTVCRFCGQSKAVKELFCPNCGRSQS
jgi:hypothetical protein